jgi:uncharacterized protein YqjF (DUF2071 family)
MAHLVEEQILQAVAHRPWPLPTEPWVARQTWRDLLFAHWRVSRDLLRDRVPSFLQIDTYDEEAWLGITPFRVTDSTARGVPAIPWISTYTELNVRTYVVYDGIPGVYFFSLDADSTLAVTGATTLFHLPYFLAQMHMQEDRNDIDFESRRVTASDVQFHAKYGPASRSFEPQPGTLEHWLTERYCLYTTDSHNRGYRVDIHHRPWQIEVAEGTIDVNTMADAAGLRLTAMTPLLHLSRRQDTLIWSPRMLQ